MKWSASGLVQDSLHVYLVNVDRALLLRHVVLVPRRHMRTSPNRSCFILRIFRVEALEGFPGPFRARLDSGIPLYA